MMMAATMMGLLKSIAVTSIAVTSLLLNCSGGGAMAYGQRLKQTTFTAKDGIFKIVYPQSFRFVAHSKIDAGETGSIAPLCQDAALLCVTYPESKYPGTTFEGAGFEINVVPAKTNESCLTPPSDPDTGVPGYSYRVAFVVSRTHPSRTINGVTFEHGEAAGVATGHVVSTDLYRNFHHGKCYELSVNIAESNFERTSSNEPREFSAADLHRVRNDIDRILDSFEFLK